MSGGRNPGDGELQLHRGAAIAAAGDAAELAAAPRETQRVGAGDTTTIVRERGCAVHEFCADTGGEYGQRVWSFQCDGAGACIREASRSIGECLQLAG